MNTLVIGATGFIGKNFIRCTKIKNIYKTSSKRKKGFIKFDLRTDNILELIKSKNIKKVLFLSAISNPYECELNLKNSNLINVTYTKKILNVLIKKNIYFIFFSSEYVFDGKKGNYSERSTPKTKLLYGNQKLNIEKFLYTKINKKFAIFRIAKTYGGDIGDKSIFVEFLKSAKKLKKIPVAFDQQFSALYVKDLIKIIDVFFKRKIKGTYNVCGDENLSRYEYCKKILEKFNLKKVNLIKKNFLSMSKSKMIPLNVTMNNKKIKKKINFRFTKFDFFLNILKKKYQNENN
jgi:dTDP-4-dehydrorhamnose reductase